MKRTFYKRGNGITVDSVNNTFVIGDGVSRIRITATVMAEGISSNYLYLTLRKNTAPFAPQVLSPHASGYAGSTIVGMVDVVKGDTISIMHDVNGTIRAPESTAIIETVPDIS